MGKTYKNRNDKLGTIIQKIAEGLAEFSTDSDTLGEAIYPFIEENQIGGVMLLSGDHHGARGFRIERPSGFALYEFEAATLGGVPGPAPYAPDQSAQLFGYGDSLIAFDMSQPDPEVTFRLINEQETILEQRTFTRSQLIPGKEK